MNKINLSERVYELVDRTVDEIVSSEDTINYMRGYYAAKLEPLNQAMHLAGQNVRAARDILIQGRALSADDIYVADDADADDLLEEMRFVLGLVPLRDQIESYVRSLIMPSREDAVSHEFFDDVLDGIDWCSIASDMACGFDD